MYQDIEDANYFLNFVSHKKVPGTSLPPELALNKHMPSTPLDFDVKMGDFTYEPETINLDSDGEEDDSMLQYDRQWSQFMSSSQ